MIKKMYVYAAWLLGDFYALTPVKSDTPYALLLF
jgi:hypothetical protein